MNGEGGKEIREIVGDVLKEDAKIILEYYHENNNKDSLYVFDSNDFTQVDRIKDPWYNPQLTLARNGSDFAVLMRKNAKMLDKSRESKRVLSEENKDLLDAYY